MTSTVAQYLGTTLPQRRGFHANPTQMRYAEAIAEGLRSQGVHFHSPSPDSSHHVARP